MAKILVTSSGCYATDKEGLSIELVKDKEVVIDDKQANVFVKSKRATLVLNKKK